MQKKIPLYARTLDSRIPKSLDKPLKLWSYKGTGYPDEHVEHLDDQLDYYHTDRDSKWKLFVLTLTEYALTWYKSLPDGNIDFCYAMYDTFIAHLTAKNGQPTTMVMLNAFIQGKKETMCG